MMVAGGGGEGRQPLKRLTTDLLFIELELNYTNNTLERIIIDHNNIIKVIYVRKVGCSLAMRIIPHTELLRPQFVEQSSIIGMERTLWHFKVDTGKKKGACL